MAIKLIANYSKRLGLPGYSSHQFSVSVETELMTSDDIPGESERLYQLLQSNVDEQILTTGFVPPADYGMDAPAGNHHPQRLQSVPQEVSTWRHSGPAWKCSDKQRDLILKIVDEHHLDKSDIEALATERFGKGVRLLNKVEASGLIDELLDTYGGKQRQQGNSRNPGRKLRETEIIKIFLQKITRDRNNQNFLANFGMGSVKAWKSILCRFQKVESMHLVEG